MHIRRVRGDGSKIRLRTFYSSRGAHTCSTRRYTVRVYRGYWHACSVHVLYEINSSNCYCFAHTWHVEIVGGAPAPNLRRLLRILLFVCYGVQDENRHRSDTRIRRNEDILPDASGSREAATPRVVASREMKRLM